MTSVEGQVVGATSPKRRTKLVVCGILLVAMFLDWARPPQQQISVPLYEALVIRGYRSTIRPVTSLITRCRFKPSCSQYSSEAVQKYGLPKGAWLTAKRLARDMPWVPLGTPDPIP